MAYLIIRGMKMPQRCKACRFCGFGGRMSELNVCMFTGESQPKLSQERMSKCPLLPLPEGHGRLGDLDALSKEFEHRASLDWNQKAAPHSWAYAYSEAQAAVDDSPTIVPAEGEADNG